MIRKKFFIGIVVLSFAALLSASDTLRIADLPWMTVVYSGEAKIFNTTFDKLEYVDPFYHAQGDTQSYVKVMEIQPDASVPDIYSIIFHMGEAAVMSYEFYLEGEFITPAFTFYADHLILPGNGIVIAQGSTNEMFRRSREYKIQHAKISEIKQPFYAVDMVSEAMTDFDVFLSKKMRDPVDHVSKGEEITVLLAEFKRGYTWYLVKTAKGLTGWMKIKPESWVDETPVKHIYYHGD